MRRVNLIGSPAVVLSGHGDDWSFLAHW